VKNGGGVIINGAIFALSHKLIFLKLYHKFFNESFGPMFSPENEMS